MALHSSLGDRVRLHLKKTVKDLKIEERIKSCSGLKASKESWQLSATWDSELNPLAVKMTLWGLLVKLEWDWRIGSNVSVLIS